MPDAFRKTGSKINFVYPGFDRRRAANPLAEPSRALSLTRHVNGGLKGVKIPQYLWPDTAVILEALVANCSMLEELSVSHHTDINLVDQVSTFSRIFSLPIRKVRVCNASDDCLRALVDTQPQLEDLHVEEIFGEGIDHLYFFLAKRGTEVQNLSISLRDYGDMRTTDASAVELDRGQNFPGRVKRLLEVIIHRMPSLSSLAIMKYGVVSSDPPADYVKRVISEVTDCGNGNHRNGCASSLLNLRLRGSSYFVCGLLTEMKVRISSHLKLQIDEVDFSFVISEMSANTCAEANEEGFGFGIVIANGNNSRRISAYLRHLVLESGLDIQIPDSSLLKGLKSLEIRESFETTHRTRTCSCRTCSALKSILARSAASIKTVIGSSRTSDLSNGNLQHYLTCVMRRARNVESMELPFEMLTTQKAYTGVLHCAKNLKVLRIRRRHRCELTQHVPEVVNCVPHLLPWLEHWCPRLELLELSEIHHAPCIPPEQTPSLLAGLNAARVFVTRRPDVDIKTLRTQIHLWQKSSYENRGTDYSGS